MTVIRLLKPLLFVCLSTAAVEEPATDSGAAGSASARSSAVTPAPAPLPTKSPVNPLIPLLGDPRFEVREEATKKLEQAGLAAIVPLHEAAAGENLEITCRAIKSLGAILNSEDDGTFDAAEAALEQLEASSNASAARRAAVALDSQPLRRWNRALARLQLHGGGVKWKARNEMTPSEPNPELGGNNVFPTNIMLGEKWSGGTQGLINIKRMNYSLSAYYGQMLPVRWPLPVYVIEGASVSPEALEELQRSLPGLEIHKRGQAKLGVYSDSGIGPCTISGVEPNQAAEKAGIRLGDVVVKYDGETVTDFEHLTRITRRHKAGDRVKLEVQRDGQIVALEVELSGWDELKPKPSAK
jgi:hypothetical protein